MTDAAKNVIIVTTPRQEEPREALSANDAAKSRADSSLTAGVVGKEASMPRTMKKKKNGMVAGRKRKLVSSSSRASESARETSESEETEAEPRKKYFTSGLYVDSESFSTNEVSVLSGREMERGGADSTRVDVKLEWPQPLEFGKILLSKEEDFCLPFDVWWLMINGKLETESSRFSHSKSSKEYKAIRNNLYVDIKAPIASEAAACICELLADDTKMGCKDDCLNRVVFTECSPMHCPCGERCSNQRIRKRQWASLKKILTNSRGHGVIAATDLKAGQFVIEYVGEVISEQLYRERVATQYKHQHDHYCLSVEGGIIIDGHNMGSLARFVNHSCNPNCEMQKWYVNGAYRMGLFALKDIPATTELNYDYNFDAMDNDFQKCFCRSENCRGVIGARNGSTGSKSRQGLVAFFNRKPGTKRKFGELRGDVVSDKLRSRLLEIKSQSSSASSSSTFELPLYRPMTLKERAIVCERRLFLCRNLTSTVEHFSVLLEVLRDQESKASLSSANGLTSGAQRNATKGGNIIRCICGRVAEDGLMIQCDKCDVWQHCDCMNFDPPENAENVPYLCEKCSYKEVDKNIPLKPQPVDAAQDCTYYLTFWHNGQLVIKGSCAYTSRDHALSWKNGKVRSCNRRLRMNHQEELDVFRIVALWQTDTCERFAYGFHYFRPKEIPRVPGQRFYPNEVFETKLFEVLPLDAVISPCAVMDRFSYVRGRPLGFEEKDVYVCAMSYNSKNHRTEPIRRKRVQYPISQDSSVFVHYSECLKLRKTVLADPADAQSTSSSKKPSKSGESDKRKSSATSIAPENLSSPGDEINKIAEYLSFEKRRGSKKDIVDASGLLHRQSKAVPV